MKSEALVSAAVRTPNASTLFFICLSPWESRASRSAVDAAEGMGAGVDDRAAALRDHLRRGVTAGFERAREMSVDQFAPGLGREIEDR